jgi:hypothetical protein
MDELSAAAWQPIPPEELAEMEPGEPVIVFLTEWKNGKRLNHYRKAAFQSYSPSRGLVSVSFDNDWKSFVASNGISESSVCEANVGRCEIVEDYDVHTVLGEYDGYEG